MNLGRPPNDFDIILLSSLNDFGIISKRVGKLVDAIYTYAR